MIRGTLSEVLPLHVQMLPKWENNISHQPDIPENLIGMMTDLLSSSLMAIFTAASFFFKSLVLCSIPAFVHPQECTFPAAVTCTYWDLSPWG